jgi:hypothetical protein
MNAIEDARRAYRELLDIVITITPDSPRLAELAAQCEAVALEFGEVADVAKARMQQERRRL